AYFAQTVQVLGVADVDAAFALDQFDQHRDDIAVALGDLLDRRKIIEWHARETRHQRLEAGLHLAAAGRRQRRDGPAMERFFHDDDRRHLDAFVVAVEARNFKRGFVRLAPRITEEDLVHARNRRETRAERFLIFDLVNVG